MLGGKITRKNERYIQLQRIPYSSGVSKVWSKKIFNLTFGNLNVLLLYFYFVNNPCKIKWREANSGVNTCLKKFKTAIVFRISCPNYLQTHGNIMTSWEMTVACNFRGAFAPLCPLNLNSWLFSSKKHRHVIIWNMSFRVLRSTGCISHLHFTEWSTVDYNP